ncbi:SOS response-associated peptidase family protein [Glaciecola sp. 1036]|uniref:SOS response-associated peptidase family protein n=1 Tax=Alteromonadaceae TaxID=72275 RepID=UPI003D04146A
MCGFIGYDERTITETPDLFDKLNSLSDCIARIPSYSAYPAFGGDLSKRIPLIIEDDGIKLVNAIWWFDAYQNNDLATALGNRTSFNARNLQSPFWRAALKHQRGIVLASSIGESKLVGKTKHQYLMQSKSPFLLGALYKKLPNNDYACAVITRDAHPKMEAYHDKAFPLFLPVLSHFLDKWLLAKGEIPSEVEQLLESPKLFPNLHVQRVKTYKSGQPMGKISENLISDHPEYL